MNKAVIIILFLFLMLSLSGSAVIGYLYTETNVFKSSGDSCTPSTTDSTVATYQVDSSKNCVPATCITGYSLDSTGVCSLASTTTSGTSGTTTTTETTTSGTSGTTSGTSGTTTTTSGTSGTITAITADANTCDGTVSINQARSCMKSGKEAGVQWVWADGAEPGKTCREATTYWIVEAMSSFDSAFIMKTKIPGTDLGAGIKNLLPPFITGTQFTFWAMPYDKNNKPLLKTKLQIQVDDLGAGAVCTSTGTKITDAFTNWNENKNLISVKMKVEGGAQKGIGMTIKGDDKNLAGKEAWFSGYKPLYTDHYYTLPKGYTVSAWCQGTRNRWKGYIPSEINEVADKSNNKVQIAGSCFDNAGYSRNTLSLSGW